MRLLPVALTLLAGSTAPSALGQDSDGVDLDALERRTLELRETTRTSLVCVRVTTEAVALPTLSLPGLVTTVGAGSAVTEEREGTGFVIDASGRIATTFGLVANAAKIEVRFFDGTIRAANVAGVDIPFGLGVLAAEGVPPGVTHLSAESAVNPRDGALAWLFTADLEECGAVDTQFAGVRSVKSTQAGYDRFLSAPVLLYSGAAGSPLVDRRGSLLGMAVGSRTPSLTAKTSDTAPRRTTLFVRGDDVARAAREIMENGRVRRGMLGILLREQSNEIDQTIPGGPAERTGLIEGDRVVSIEGRPSEGAADITRTLLRRRPGDRVTVIVERTERGGAQGVDKGGKKVISLRREIELAQVGLPPAPTTPPLAGVTLELNAVLGEDGAIARTVVFRDVAEDALLYRAGVRVGDRLISIDGRDALHFLARHRIRAAKGPPRTLRIGRDGHKRAITVGDR